MAINETKNKTVVVAGKILFILRIQKRLKENVPFLFSIIIYEEIKKPDITKNISTPRQPKGSKLGKK